MSQAGSRVLWAIDAGAGEIRCEAAPGCGAVELRIEQGGEVLTRESFADHSTAYERARQLRREYDEAACRAAGQPYLAAPTCAMRPWRLSDAADIARHADNPKIGRNLRDGFPFPYSIDDARDFIRRANALQPLCRFAIVVDGEAVGSIGFTLHPNVERVSAEIGYYLGESFWGRGIMADAVRAVTEYAIRTHGLTRVYAVPYAWNPASFRVLEKAGYAWEGRMRRSAIKDGEIIDQLLYAFVVAEPGNPDSLLPCNP
jgi:[ribosomal protein S5]-alanine N-acetyltransferase